MIKAANGRYPCHYKTGKRDSKTSYQSLSNLWRFVTRLPGISFLNSQEHFDWDGNHLRNLYRKNAATIPNPEQEAKQIKLVSGNEIQPL
jgi:hypothetical protein